MEKRKFEELIGQSITDEDYEVAEMAYLFHPAFRSMSLKDFAEFYQSCGKKSFYYHSPAIKEYRDLVSQIRHTRDAIGQVEKELAKLRRKEDELKELKQKMWDAIRAFEDHTWITYYMKDLGNKK